METTVSDVCLYQENEKYSYHWRKGKVKKGSGFFWFGLSCLLLKKDI